MRVLVACEYSATVRDAFRAKGHDAWSCDLLPTDGDPQWHMQGDALAIISGQHWDLLIAHPPCTYLTNSGVTWLHRDPTRWAKLDDGAAFFKALLDAPVERVAVENPIMHKYAKERIGGVQQTQTIQPYQFGHLEQKATCLWLKGLPPLQPTSDQRRKLRRCQTTSASVCTICHHPPTGGSYAAQLTKALPKQWLINGES